MSKRLIWGISAAVGLWLSWVFQGAILKTLGIDYDQAELGQWGDTFGALNALFATLGFGAALYTLRIQQQQIAKDRFDTSFFELLKLFIDARENVKFNHSLAYIKAMEEKSERRSFIVRAHLSQNYEGLDAFQHAWVELVFWCKSAKVPEAKLVGCYEKYIHGKSEATLGPYFRLLYTILIRIERDNYLSDTDKNIYGNLVRSQLSRYEIGIVGVNGLSEISKDFDKLVTRYRLLKYSTEGRRLLLEKHYPKEAFVGRDKV